MLLQQWGTSRRASGGLWALAGFSFQAAIYLQRFFQNLLDGNNPTSLACIELLSDILVPEVSSFELIQVKRVLTVTSLKASLREAYEIAALCASGFLERLTFRIACLRRDTDMNPRDLDPAAVVGPDVDLSVWAAMIASFDAPDAICVEPDPLDRLHDLLWRAGIADTQGFVNHCQGLLSRAFASPGADAIHRLARELAHELSLAARAPGGHEAPVGVMLGHRDVEFDLKPGDRLLAFNRRPLLSDLRAGRFRQREPIFSALIESFDRWWDEQVISDDRTFIPVFWIGGRSGEGKSVLLLQLVQHLLEGDNPPPLVYLNRPEDLPSWLEVQARAARSNASRMARPAIAVIDDIHLVARWDLWEAAIRQTTDLVIPNAALLVCAPSVEKRVFQHALSTLFRVHEFAVPNLDLAEMASFADWFSARTGRSPPALPPVSGNRLLVIWMFELLQGTSIADFATAFRNRVRAFGLEDEVRTILAVNALGIAAPVAVIADLSDRQRDFFDALCAETQLHFERQEGASGGISLSHSQIGWLMYREWVTPPTTTARALGRDIARAIIAAMTRGRNQEAVAVIRRAAMTPLLPSAAPETDPAQGSIDDMLAELNAALERGLPADRLSLLLPATLEMFMRQPGLELVPDPVNAALEVAAIGNIDNDTRGYLAAALWRLQSHPRYRARQSELRRATRQLLLMSSSSPTEEFALVTVAAGSSNRADALALCRLWLRSDAALTSTGHALASFLSAWPEDDEIVSRAIDWVERNVTRTGAGTVIPSLLAARPKDRKLRDLSVTWIQGQRFANTPVTTNVLVSLLACWKSDEEILAAAIDVVRRNPLDLSIRDALQVLLVRSPDAEGVRTTAERWIAAHADKEIVTAVIGLLIKGYKDERAVALGMEWCRDNPLSENLSPVLVALLAIPAELARAVPLAMKWLERFPDLAQSMSVWAKLIGSSRAPAVMHAAHRWVEERIARPEVYDLLGPLVKADESGFRGTNLALAWLKLHGSHPMAYQLLIVLIARGRKAREVLRVALAWLDTFPDHANASQLYTPLVAKFPANRKIQAGVRRWLNDRHYHPKFSTLLTTLIVRTKGAPHWMEYGDRYAAATTEGAGTDVLLALAKASGADLRYLQKAVPRILTEVEGSRGRAIHVHALGIALSNNMENAARFLSAGGTWAERELAADALGLAIAQFTYLRSGYLDLLLTVPSSITARVIVTLLCSDVPLAGATEFLRLWLETYRGCPGYGDVMNTLQSQPATWKELNARERLSADVRRDYQRQERR